MDCMNFLFNSVFGLASHFYLSFALTDESWPWRMGKRITNYL